MSEFQQNLLNIALALGMLFLVGLSLYRTTREITPLGDKRERIAALYIAAIFISGSGLVAAGLLDWEVASLIARISTIASVWGFNFFILRYWAFVASGAVKGERQNTSGGLRRKDD